MAKTNLFQKAEKKSSKQVVKNEKIVVSPSFKPAEARLFQENFKRYVNIQKQIAELSAEALSYEEEIRYQGKQCFLSAYKNSGKNPDSFLMESGECSVMMIPTDKYKKIDEERSGQLTSKWGEEVVTKKTEFKFNMEVLERNMDAISEMIEKSKKISDEDKERLIEAVVTYSVAKGAIDKAPIQQVEEYIEDISPVIMLKNFKA